MGKSSLPYAGIDECMFRHQEDVNYEIAVSDGDDEAYRYIDHRWKLLVVIQFIVSDQEEQITSLLYAEAERTFLCDDASRYCATHFI